MNTDGTNGNILFYFKEAVQLQHLNSRNASTMMNTDGTNGNILFYFKEAVQLQYLNSRNASKITCVLYIIHKEEN